MRVAAAAAVAAAADAVPVVALTSYQKMLFYSQGKSN